MLKDVAMMDESVKNKIEKTTTLTHFYKDNENNFTSLKDDYIWFSELSAFNDPFDVMLKEDDLNSIYFSNKNMVKFLQINKGMSLADQHTGNHCQAYQLPEDSLMTVVEKNHEKLSNFIKSYIIDFANSKKELKFQCFSHNVGLEPIESKLMWSHYASGMRGFAIEFNFDDILASMYDMNQNNFSEYTFMNYVTMGFNDYIQSQVENEKPLFVEQLIFAKHLDWEYEREVRIMSKTNEIKYNPSCISKVVIGGRMEEYQKNRIIDILKEKNMLGKLFVAEFNRNDFSIRLNKLFN